MEETRYTLLTGATGLVGQKLLGELLQARVPVAVISRPDRQHSAVERIDQQLSRMEKHFGRTFVRPVVLTGVLTAPGLGLPASQQDWIKAHCRRILHCAASVSFKPAADHPQREPWTTNVEGTRRLADLCCRLGIGEFHHISSAYLCGLRNGLVLESETDVGQPFANDYEASKCDAELLLRERTDDFRLTVYRPSIVIPIGGTGTMAMNQTLGLAFHTLRALARQTGLPTIENLQQLLELTGQERKNIVSVEWVSRMIVKILLHPELHGETYHLTHARGISMSALLAAFHEVLAREFPPCERPLRLADLPVDSGMSDLFSLTLSAYLRDDPQFDRTHLDQALRVCRELPCPDLESELPAVLEDSRHPRSDGHFTPAVEPRKLAHSHLQTSSSSTFAIVGMDCALPGAADLEEFRELLFTSRSGIADLPEEQLDRGLYFSPQRGTPGKTYTTLGGTVPAREISRSLPGLSPEEVRRIDPVHLRFCDVAVRAWMRAGLGIRSALGQRTGVYVGHSGATRNGGALNLATQIDEGLDFLNDLEEFRLLPASARDRILRSTAASIRRSRPQRRPGALPRFQAATVAMLPARVLGLAGPRIVCDAACASALFSMQQAMLAIEMGRIDAAIVGGATVNGVDNLILFSHSQACSDIGSTPFDARANGLISSEGYAAVVIMREETAHKLQLPILGIIEGMGISSDGRGKSLWAPRAEGQQLAMRRAYPTSPALEIDYLEAHATSTQLGDATELQAVSSIRQSARGSRSGPLLIGSLKSNLGHTLETAGVAGLIKILLAMQEERIPATLHFERPNPNFDWSADKVEVVDRQRTWPAGRGRKRAAVSAFGIGGLNAHLVIREASPGPAPREKSSGEETDHNTDHFEPIAIVGRGLVLPGAHRLEQFRSLMASGTSMIGPPPPGRWRQTSLKRIPHARGGFIRDYEFDAQKYRIPPKQVRQANPLQWMLLDTVAQAIQEYDGSRWSMDRQRTGVVIGTIFDGDFGGQLQLGLRLPEIERELRAAFSEQGVPADQIDDLLRKYRQQVLNDRPALLDETGSFTASTLSSRIAKTFDLMGGACSVDADDASGLAAVRLALDQLRTGRWEVAVCGAASRSMDLPAFEQLQMNGLLLPSGRPREIPDDFRQILPGEGAVVFLLERLSQAQAAGHRILGVIDDVDFTARTPEFPGTGPDRPGSHFGLDARLVRQMGYVPGVQSLVQLFEWTVDWEHHAGQSTSVERNLGAEDAGAGRVPLLPHHRTLTNSTPDGMLYHLRARAAAAATVSASSRNPVSSNHRRAGRPATYGHNTQSAQDGLDQSMTPQFPPKTLRTPTHPGHSLPTMSLPTSVETVGQMGSVPCSFQVFRLQADSSEQLGQRIDEVIARPEIPFRQPINAFTPSGVWRLVVLADSPTQLATRLKSMQKIRARGRCRGVFETERALLWSTERGAVRVGWVFPGQGGHYPDLPAAVSSSGIVSKALDRIDAELVRTGLSPLRPELSSPQPHWASGLWESQLWGLGLSLSLTAELNLLGRSPDVVLGHSFGEYSALVAAGCLTLPQVIRMVRSRADAVAMTVDEPGQLISVRASPSTVEAVIRQYHLPAQLTHWNAPHQTVIAVELSQLGVIRQKLAAANLASVPVSVPVAFHTSRLSRAEELLKNLYSQERFLPPVCPLLSATSVHYLSEPDDLQQALTSQLTRPVLYVPAMERLLADNVGLLIEAGPNQVLSKLNREIAGERALCLSFDLPGRDHAERRLLVQAALEIIDVADAEIRPPSRTTSLLQKTSGEAGQTHAAESFSGDETASRNDVEIVDLHRPARHTHRLDVPAFPGEQSSHGEVPCSTSSTSIPASVDASLLQEIHDFLLTIVIDLTGYAPEVIDFEADLEADLGIDSIKKAQIIGELAETFQIAEPPLGAMLSSLHSLNDLAALTIRSGTGSTSNPPVVEEPRFPPATTPRSSLPSLSDPRIDIASIERFLIDLVVDQTGYSQDVVDLDADMEGDLGIDSIKQAQILGEVQQQFELPSVVGANNALTSFSTLRSILDYLAKELPVHGSTAFRLSAADAPVGENRHVGEGRLLPRTPRLPVAEDASPLIGTSRSFDAASTGSRNDHLLPIEAVDPTGTMRCLLRMVPAPHRPGLPESPQFTGPALILGTNPIADALEEQLRNESVPCVRVPAVSSLSELDACLDQIWQENSTPHLFLTTSHDDDALREINATAWKTRRFAALEVPYRLCQRWMQRMIDAGTMNKASLISVVDLGGDFGFSGTGGFSPEGGQAGLVKAMLIEAWMRGERSTPMKVIDIAPGTSPQQAVAGIWRELARPSYDMEVAWHGDQRFTVQAVASPLPLQRERASQQASRVRPRGVWVVTGGARGITAVLARELAQRHGLILHLIGTAPPPALSAEWKEAARTDRLALRRAVMSAAARNGENGMEVWRNVEKSLEIDETLHQLQAVGIAATYHGCDVSDADQLKWTLERIRTLDGPIAGVIHGAGIGQDARFDRKRPDKVDQCLRAKIDGCINLIEATRNDPLDIFVTFGSISGRFGANGHTDYSLANDTMAKLVDRYRSERPDVASFTFHWHAWGEVGMATKPETRLALEMIQLEFMPAREGIDHFLNELERGGEEPEILITNRAYLRKFYPVDRGLPSASSTGTAPPVFPMLDPEGVLSGKTDGSFVVEFSAEKERFLNQHLIQGTPTLPFVMALELMAEAARKVTGNPVVREARNVQAFQALKWSATTSRQIQVRTRSHVSHTDDESSVACALVSDVHRRDGRLIAAEKVYFDGEFLTGFPGTVSAANAVPHRTGHSSELNSLIWSSISYPGQNAPVSHGPDLQCLQAISISENQAFGRIAASSIVQLAGGHRPITGWSLHGAVMDACLYACALLAGKRFGKASLPVRFERIGFGRLPDPGEPCLVAVHLDQEAPHGAVMSFQLTGLNGDLLLDVEGYHLNWLKDLGHELREASPQRR